MSDQKKKVLQYVQVISLLAGLIIWGARLQSRVDVQEKRIELYRVERKELKEAIVELRLTLTELKTIIKLKIKEQISDKRTNNKYGQKRVIFSNKIKIQKAPVASIQHFWN